jgi:hypothetical protein
VVVVVVWWWCGFFTDYNTTLEKLFCFVLGCGNCCGSEINLKLKQKLKLLVDCKVTEI